MKIFLKNQILKFVNNPSKDILSSQTLYEAMFYLLNVRDEIDDSQRNLANLIVQTQLEDGGFDIGYDFQFGPNLSKTHEKEGTSPELLSLVALAKYYRRDSSNLLVKDAIDKGVNWILSRVVKLENNQYAIPYAPDSYRGIHITNATSFCISALAHCLEFMDNEQKAKAEVTLDGMYQFMAAQLEPHGNSSYWPYFYQGATGEEKLNINNKIDNYHMAQQLYHHILAEEYYPSKDNLKAINLVGNYLLTLVDESGYIPYTNFEGRISDKVHLWGYASLIPAFVRLYAITNQSQLLVGAESVKKYILDNCYIGPHFAPIILNSDKTMFDTNFYPRSDAWVIHGLSELKLIGAFDLDTERSCSASFEACERQSFRGLENHAVTWRMKVFASLVRFFIH